MPLFRSIMSVIFSLQCPLYEASSNGHSEIVELLLQAKRINVNQWVRIITSIPAVSPFSPYYHLILSPFLCISDFVPSTVATRHLPLDSLRKWPYRDRGLAVTGQGN